MKPIITIIVPVYNSGKYLSKCLESILAQSFSYFELIIINDGSTDNSLSIINNYSILDNRIKVIDKVNGGQSSARNIGISEAIGDYLLFVDSDDFIDSNMLLILYENLKKTNADISICDSHKVKQHKFKKINEASQLEVFDKVNVLEELLKNQKINFSPWGKLYKSMLFNDLKFKENMIFEDLDLSYKILEKSNKVVYDNRKLYFYFLNSNGTIHSKFNLKKIDEFYAKKSMLEFYDMNYRHLSKTIVVDLFFTRIRLYCKISKHFKNDLDKYTFLIDFNYMEIKTIIINSQLSLKRKVIYRLYNIDPKNFLKICPYIIR